MIKVINEIPEDSYTGQHKKFFQDINENPEVLILTHFTLVDNYALLKSKEGYIIPVELFLECSGADILVPDNDYEDSLVEFLKSHGIKFTWEVRASMGEEGKRNPWTNMAEFFQLDRSASGAGKWVRSSKEYMRHYCLEGGTENYQYASEDLRADKDFFKEVNGYGILKYASSDIQDDEELVLLAISRDPGNLNYRVSKQFPEGSSLHFASERLRGDLEFCRQALNIVEKNTFDEYETFNLFGGMTQEVREILSEERYAAAMAKIKAKKAAAMS